MDEVLKRGKFFLFAESIFKLLNYECLLNAYSQDGGIELTHFCLEKVTENLVLHSDMKCYQNGRFFSIV